METASRYKEEFKSWAQRINWRTWDMDFSIWIVKISTKAPDEDQEEEEDDEYGMNDDLISFAILSFTTLSFFSLVLLIEIVRNV